MTELFNFKIRIKNLNIPKTVWVEKAPNKRAIYDKYIKVMDARGFKYIKTDTRDLTESALIFHPVQRYHESMTRRSLSGLPRLRRTRVRRPRSRISKRDQDYDVIINVKKL